jgi:ABC-type multidrug transport system ATPase subunit
LFAGLDARAAAIVMKAVKAVAAGGHTVLVTIHQPSINIFEAFDQLLLLQVRPQLCSSKVLSTQECCAFVNACRQHESQKKHTAAARLHCCLSMLSPQHSE